MFHPVAGALGEAAEYGCYAVEDKVHVRDLRATMLSLLGIDHERPTRREAGRDFRRTDIEGCVITGVMDQCPRDVTWWGL